LYTIAVKPQDGQIRVDGQRFSRKFTWQRLFRFLADESLGAPIAEAESQARKLHKSLTKRLTDEEIPEIIPLVLFTNKNVNLSVNNPAIPVMRTSELKSFLREQGKNRKISADQRKQLAGILSGE
jgi:hypothetical protein